MATEIEAKIKVDDLLVIRRRLDALGAGDEGGVNERNWVLDDSVGSLAERGMLLRVRNFGGEDCVLTVKRPLAGGEFKTREEVETTAGSVRNLLRQLEMLGYGVNWVYEKRRQIWWWRHCVVALDECPEIGSFVEIEGDPGDIRAVCADLGLDPGAHIDDNYLLLWMRHLKERGESWRDMVFGRAGDGAADPAGFAGLRFYPLREHERGS